MTTNHHSRRSGSHALLAGAALTAVLISCAWPAGRVLAHEIDPPAAAQARVEPAPFGRATGQASLALVGLSRVTCPGPEQTRPGGDWFARPVGEQAALLALPVAGEAPSGRGGLERVKPISIKPSIPEFPPPVIAPDIKPAWQPRNVEASGFQWGAAIRQSLRFLAVQHAFRLATEEGTRAELKGPFFKDYFATLRRVRGWHDGDPFIVNYVGHPMMGAVSGYIQVQNDPRGRKQEVGFNKEYFKSRLKAFGWSALYSTQFELGPLGEAAIGNIGIRPTKKWDYPMAYVDLVVTPVMGTVWLIGEDALDKYVVRPIENRVRNQTVRLLVRSFLNPSRTMANVLRSKWPWYRDDRKLNF
jgi:hypothetical protein